MHPKLLWFRYKLFRYRRVERHIASQRVRRVLDIGCGDGENLLRFADLPLLPAGLEISFPRLVQARRHGLPVFQASGAALPAKSACIDLVYIAHVLHHVSDHSRVLQEALRCLAPGGRIFLVETVTDSPLLRLGRKARPSWQGDVVETEWDYAELTELLKSSGFEIELSERYNIFFFLWEMVPLAFWPFEVLTPFFVLLDLMLERFLLRYAAHCYFVLKANSA